MVVKVGRYEGINVWVGRTIIYNQKSKGKISVNPV